MKQVRWGGKDGGQKGEKAREGVRRERELEHQRCRAGGQEMTEWDSQDCQRKA